MMLLWRPKSNGSQHKLELTFFPGCIFGCTAGSQSNAWFRMD
jgi:hypothetical protein